MSFLSAQPTGVDITAVRWPACACGHALEAHACAGWHPVGNEPCGCRGYVGVGEALGTRAYTPSPALPAWRRAACMAAWAVEARLQGWRERWDPK